MNERAMKIQEARRRQPLAELKRKKLKAVRRSFFTAEDLDYAWVWAREMADYFERTDETNREPNEI